MGAAEPVMQGNGSQNAKMDRHERVAEADVVGGAPEIVVERKQILYRRSTIMAHYR